MLAGDLSEQTVNTDNQVRIRIGREKSKKKGSKLVVRISRDSRPQGCCWWWMLVKLNLGEKRGEGQFGGVRRSGRMSHTLSVHCRADAHSGALHPG